MASAWQDSKPSDGAGLEQPEWIQCDSCEKWRKLQTQYILSVQDGPWSCNQSQLAITCSDACDSCKQDTCSCGKSGYWQDPTDPDKCAFVFGAQTPAGFNLLVKQKPAGQLYVEYDVVCSRCQVQAILDRGWETSRDKEKQLQHGKGNPRTLECWLRHHQGCNANWSKMTANCLSFKVPLGYRRFRDVKSPLYTPLAPATSSSSQSSESASYSSDTSSAQSPVPQSPSASIHPASNLQVPPDVQTRPTVPTGPCHVSQPANPVKAEPMQNSPALAKPLPIASAITTKLEEVPTTPASASASVATSDPQTSLPKPSNRASSHVKGVYPSSQCTSVLTNKLCQGQMLLQGQLFRQPVQALLVQPSTFSSRSGNASCAIGGDARQHPLPGTKSHTYTAEQTVADVATVSKEPTKGGSKACSQLQHEAGRKHSKMASAGTSPFSAPRGLNGLLLSRSCKRKSPSAALQPASSQMQAASTAIDLTYSEDDAPKSEGLSEGNKRIKKGLQTDANMDAESVQIMVEQVNQNLKEKPISVTQLEKLQSVVDNVCELRLLQRSELTDVLKRIGQLETIQMIYVRRYLQCS